MKIVITDFPKVLKRNVMYEKDLLEKEFPGCQVVIHPYENDDALIEQIKDADAMLTAFLRINEKILSKAEKLKCIGVNASGFETIDLESATRHNVIVAPIGEYCTEEVAEHAITLMMALARGIKHYQYDIEEANIWQYTTLSGVRRISGQTLGIFGLGRIGMAVAEKAQSLGMKVMAYSPWTSPEIARKMGIELVDPDTICKKCQVITNHMSQNSDNYHFFNKLFFSKLKQHPIFINVARGAAVDEHALIDALDQDTFFGVGLDVLEAEKPDLMNCRLKRRKNVILTPHAAFYSMESLRELQDISCRNVIESLRGNYEKVDFIVNKQVLKV